MSETRKQMTFPAACKAYFGYLENQAASGFIAEIKALTLEDRADLTPLLVRSSFFKVGLYPTTPRVTSRPCCAGLR
jgi:hypothetical protein